MTSIAETRQHNLALCEKDSLQGLVAAKTMCQRLSNELSTGNYGNYNSSFGYNSRGLLTNETRTTFMPTINSFSYDGMNCRCVPHGRATATKRRNV